ncbi:MAG TPA: hypothetical protein VEB22_12060 [Phycisphaerales bacterium]|nr:hypothetical protein [Phycisphaerales bacterium]
MAVGAVLMAAWMWEGGIRSSAREPFFLAWLTSLSTGIVLLWPAKPFAASQPRCNNCGYSLAGLKDGAACPECGKSSGAKSDS